MARVGHRDQVAQILELDIRHHPLDIWRLSGL
jgi:hypothetical protein